MEVQWDGRSRTNVYRLGHKGKVGESCPHCTSVFPFKGAGALAPSSQSFAPPTPRKCIVDIIGVNT